MTAVPEHPRTLARYSEERLRQVVTMQREVNPGTHDELLADLCAEVLTNGQGDARALENANAQVLSWIVRHK